MPSGDLVGTGQDEWDGWLARIAPDGHLLWERRIGNDVGGAVTPLPDNRLVVAGFVSSGSSTTKDYQDHVTTWILSGSGNVIAETRVRNSINTFQHAYFAQIKVATAKTAIYVVSEWNGLFDAKPIQISKLDFDGRLLWTTELPESAVEIKGKVSTWRSCAPTLAIDPRGEAMIACALDSQIHLYQLDASSGHYRKSDLPLPDCQAEHPAALFLAARPDGTWILTGSRPGSNLAANCTWMGQLTATP
jgi:hypothetical protein